MPGLEISLLGNPIIRAGGLEFDTDRRKTVALLAYLVVTGREQTREHLAGFFWPDYPRDSAFAYLRRTLWELNKGIGKGWIVSSRSKVGFDLSAGARIDTVLFEVALRAAPVADDPVQDLEKACGLYRGEFLADFLLQDAGEFENWQQVQAENFRRAYAEALEQLAGIYANRGDWEPALEKAQFWLLLDMLDENAHRALMRIYAGMGDRAGVIRQYEACRDELAQEVGLEPEPETTALYERLVEGSPDPAQVVPGEPVAAATPASTTLHLPALATPFIGRRQEVEQIKGLVLSMDNRLVTLVGPGGGGKTRLAIQCAAETGDAFSDGVWFVPLAPILTPEDIVPTLAKSLNFNFYREEERPRRQLLDYLREKNLLLVLDNFEQLVGPEAQELLTEVLTGAEHVKLLVTSRTRLNLPGEQLYAVGGMQLPSADQAAEWVDPAVEAQKFSALGLFIDRARRVRSDFELGRENVEAIVETCRLVAGMPLGIELAASWLELLSPKEIAAEIRRSMDFLETDQPAVPERQRSFRAVFDYSWKMLNEIERDAFLALSVFSGDFSREAAEAVSGGSLRTLLSLANKSWLQQAEDGRFQLHPLLRHYGLQQLEANNEIMHQAQERHALFYARFLAEQSIRMEGPAQYEAAALLDREVESNIRFAWNWLVSEKRWEILVHQMVLGLLKYSSLRWNSDALIRWMRIAREALEGASAREEKLAYIILGTMEVTYEETWSIKDNYPEARLEKLYKMALEENLVEDLGLYFVVLGSIYDSRNRGSGALPYIDETIEHLRTKGLDWQVGVSLLYSGNVWQSDFSHLNEAVLNEAWDIFERLGVIYEKALVIEQMGMAAKVKNRPVGEVLDALKQAQEYYRQAEDPMGVAGTYFNMANLFEHRGGFNRFVEYRRKQRQIYRSMGKQFNLAFSYHWEGMIAARYDTFEHAREAELAAFEEIKKFAADLMLTWMGWSQHQLGEIHRIFGYPEPALEYLDRADEAFKRLKYELGLGYVQRSHGDFDLAAGRLEAAVEKYEAYLAYALADNHPWSISEAHARLAWVHARRGDAVRARAEIAQSLEISYKWNEPDLEILVLLAEAYCQAAEGAVENAVELAAWIAAHPHTWNEVVDLANRLLAELGAAPVAMPADFSEAQIEGGDVRKRIESWLARYLPTAAGA